MKPSFLKSALLLFQSRIINQILGFAQSVFIRRTLGPGLSGIYDLFNLVQFYLMMLNLGIMGISSREITYRHGKGNYSEESALKQLLFTTIIIESIFAFIAVLLYLLMESRLPPGIKYTFLLLPFIVFFSKYNAICSLILSSLQRFDIDSKMMILGGLVSFFFTVIGVYFWGLWGVFLGILFGSISSFTFYWFSMMKFEIATLKYRWNKALYFSLLKLGVPIELGKYILNTTGKLDTILIVWWLGTSSLAIYSVAVAIFFQTSRVLTIAGAVISPRLIEKFSQHDMLTDIAQDLYTFMIANVTVVIPFGCLLGIYGGEWLVHTFLPKFSDCIPCLQILTFSVFFESQQHLLLDVFVIKKKVYTRLLFLGICLAIQYVSILSFYSFNASIYGVALGAFWGYCVSYIVVLTVSTRNILSLWRLLKILAISLLSFGYSYIIFSCGTLITVSYSGIVKMFVEIISALVLLAPMAILGLWITGNMGRAKLLLKGFYKLNYKW